MYLHTDQGYVDTWTPPKPLVANIMWMLDDFTEANGGTRRWSQEATSTQTASTILCRTSSPPRVGGARPDLRPADGPRHRLQPTTERQEHVTAFSTYFCRPFVRQQEEFICWAWIPNSAGPSARRLPAPAGLLDLVGPGPNP